MAIYTISDDLLSAFRLLNGDTLTLQADGSVTNSDPAAGAVFSRMIDGTGLAVTATINGTIDSVTAGLALEANSATVTIGATGVVEADAAGLKLAVGSATVSNSGMVSGATGIALSDQPLFAPSTGTVTITNSGTIAGDLYAIYAGANVTTQTIKITNTGVLVGDVLLGNGNDTFDGSLGQHFPADGAAIPRVLGLDGNDKLSGGASAEHLDGGNGNDSISGGGGDDRLYGGAGNDAVTGGAGDDVIDGGAGDDQISGGIGADTLFGGDGTDTLAFNTAVAGVEADLIAGVGLSGEAAGDSYSGFEIVIGSAFDDILRANGSLIGGAGNDVLVGGAGGDRLEGGQGADLLKGGAGNDTYVVDAADTIEEIAGGGIDSIIAAATIDLESDSLKHAEIENATLEPRSLNSYSLFGNALDNRLIGNGANNLLEGRDGNDTLDGLSGTDILRGGGGNDVLLGGADKDVLEGNAGNDHLDGGTGNDTMQGGAGDDVYWVDSAGDIVDELSDSGGGIDTVISSISLYPSGQFKGDIENFTLNGSENLYVLANELDNIIVGNFGANELRGFDGNDTLDGLYGADVMRGGRGNDIYVVDNVSDRVDEFNDFGDGVDLVRSSVSYDLGRSLVTGNVENLTLLGNQNIDATGNGLDNVLTGNKGKNTLTGGAGNDTLDGGASEDRMRGGVGNDLYFVESAGDRVDEAAASGNGVDSVRSTISFNLGGPAVLGQVENLALLGSANIDATGNGLDNRLEGNAGRNVLSGGGGKDVLIGGLGNDTLTGGAGADSFVFNTLPHGSTNRDVITDFDVTADTIRLQDSVFTALLGEGKLSGAQFTANAAGVALDASDRIIYETDTGRLIYDSNGSAAGGAVEFALLKPNLSLHADDFLIV